jgi:thioredoxin 1
MEQFFLFMLALGCFILVIRWRVGVAQKRLEGKDAPEAIRTDKQHPDGVIFYFYHPICGPCRQMEPIIDQLIQSYPDRVEKLNVADCQELTSAIGIKATPTTIYVKNNKIVKAIIGSINEKSLEKLLNPAHPLNTTTS